MTGVKRSASSERAALIGDIVGLAARVRPPPTASPRSPRRSAGTPPAFTVGDEFQGSYPTVGDGDRRRADGAAGRRTRDRRAVRHRLGRGDHARRRAPASRTVPAGGRRAKRSNGPRPPSSSRRWRPCAPPTAAHGADRTGPRRRQRRTVVSGPPAWIGRCPVPATAAGAARPQDEEGIGGNGRHQRLGGVPADRARRPGPAVLASATKASDEPAESAMSGVAVLLIAIGCADIVRRLDHPGCGRPWSPGRWSRWPPPRCAGCGTSVICCWSASPRWPPWPGSWSCRHAERVGGRRQAAPLVLFVAVLAVLIVLSGRGLTGGRSGQGLGGLGAAWPGSARPIRPES